MRGAGNTVNTVGGESALSCNTFGRRPMAGFPTHFHRRKRKTGLVIWALETDSHDQPTRLFLWAWRRDEILDGGHSKTWGMS
jgi:hypothetical protein